MQACNLLFQTSHTTQYNDYESQMLLNQLTFSWVKNILQPDSSYIMQNSVHLIVISKMSAFEGYMTQCINRGLLSR